MANTVDLIPGSATAPAGRFRRSAKIRVGEGRPLVLLGIQSILFGFFSAVYFSIGLGEMMAGDQALWWTLDEVSAAREPLVTLLPWLYIAGGLAGLLAPWLFLILAKRFAFTRTVQVILGVLILFVAAFTLALPEIQDVSMAYRVGGAMFASIPTVLGLIDLVFWGIVERVFDIEQRQRLKRVVSTVWLGGAVFGFFSVSLSVFVTVMVNIFPPAAAVVLEYQRYLLALAGTGLVLSFIPFHLLSKRYFKANGGQTRQTKAGSPVAAIRSLRERYVLLLGALMALLVMNYHFVDFIFLTSPKRGKEMDITNPEFFVAAILGFAFLFFVVKLVELLFQIFGSPRLMRRFGPAYGLLALPVITLIACAISFSLFYVDSSDDMMFYMLGTWSVKLLEVVFRGSAFEPSFDVLFQPLTAPERRAARTAITYWVRPFAVLVTGLALILVSFFQDGTHVHLAALIMLSFVLIALLLCSSLALRRYWWKIRETMKPPFHAPIADPASLERIATLPNDYKEQVVHVLTILPLFLAESLETGRMNRNEAFGILANLPGQGPVSSVRNAAARRCCKEIKTVVAHWLLQIATVEPRMIPVESSLGLMGPAPLKDDEHATTSLAVLGDLGQTFPRKTPADDLEGHTETADEAALLNTAMAPSDKPLGALTTVHDPANPFPGLRPFESDEMDRFFGRKEHTEELVRKLSHSRFLAVVGTSGSGKSSLVRAGLLPALSESMVKSASSSWRVALFRPGSDPIGELARALAKPGVLGDAAGPADESDAKLQATITETTLRRSALGIAEAVRHRRLEEDENLLIVVDQFEEVFRFKREIGGRRGSEDAAAFVKLLLEASRSGTPPIYIVLTMRSDYLGDCAQFRDLPEAINEGQYLIPRLTRDQRREVITGPVNLAAGAVTPRLIQRLLNDVGDDPDQLPVLQHALMRVWDYWSAMRHEGEPMDIKHYDAIGRMATALSCHADEVYGELTDARACLVSERLFKTLTDRGEDGRGMRRAQRLEDLCRVIEANPTEIASVIEAFRKPGCSFLMPPTVELLDPDTVVDISHESLMRVWTRLRDWVDEEIDSARIYRRLVETAMEWHKKKAGWWSGLELGYALEWRDKQQPNGAWAQRYHPEFASAMEFLDASDQAAQLARRQHSRRTVRFLLIFVGLTVPVAWLHNSAQEAKNDLGTLVDSFVFSRLANDCKLLFAPESVTDDDLESEANNCKAALRSIEELAGSLEGYEKTLNRLTDWLEEQRRTEREYSKQVGSPTDTAESLQKGTLSLLLPGTSKRRLEQLQLQYETTKRLVDDVHYWKQISGILSAKPNDVYSEQRLEKIINVMAASFPKWREAVDAIASNPVYNGLQIEPQVGLIPLGEDPESDLWEFAHISSGEVPERGRDGQLRRGQDTGVVLVLIPGGSFQMGRDQNPNHDDSDDSALLSLYAVWTEIPQHQVTVGPFFLSKYELTQSQWRLFAGSSNSRFKGDNLPEDSVTFGEGSKITALVRLRLPSEAEWEYAARAGTQTNWSFGDAEDGLHRYAWHSQNANEQSHEVGTREPNRWGLYDMQGNVFEWVQDCWHENYNEAPQNGSAWETDDCSKRIVRGGAWGSAPAETRLTLRLGIEPDGRYFDIGLRVARQVMRSNSEAPPKTKIGPAQESNAERQDKSDPVKLP